ncbi:MFS transporter [Vibrio sp. PP-XX7]
MCRTSDGAKFSYSVTMMAILFMLSSLATTVTLPVIGKLIDKIGEKKALITEYIALALVFISYAYVDNHYVAGILYVADCILFSFTVALSSYFKKTIRSNEIAATSGISFTINHIAAVFLPFLLGMLWVTGYQFVFMTGAAISVVSFFVALSIKEAYPAKAGIENVI